MRYRLALVGLFTLITPWLSGATSDAPFALVRSAHPRLLLTDEALASAVAAAKTDPTRAALHARIVATAESVLSVPLAQYLPAGNLSLDQQRCAVYAILHCAMAYRLTRDEQFLARAKMELMNVARFPDWNPDHFLDIGELSFAVAVGYDWLYARLDTEEREWLQQALRQKSLALAERAYAAKGEKGRRVEWASKPSNWNQVCNGGVLCAALVLADEDPALAERIVEGVRRSLPIGMTSYAPDGEYPEGPGYWTYGTTYNVIGLAALEGVLGNDYGLASLPGFDRTIDYIEAIHGPFGLPFNYADSSDDPQNSPARAWLAQRFRRSVAQRSARTLLTKVLAEGTMTPFDPTIQAQVVNRFFPLHAVWFPAEPTEAGTLLPLDQHFRGVADLATFRSAWGNPKAIFVGLKAGENSFHHNHLDLGSFVLDANGVRWAVDLGPDSYELPGYFDYKGRRWEYFRLNNRSHNLITPGDCLQKMKIVAPITRFASRSERAFAIADLSAVYPDGVTSWHRGVALLDRARVLVQDELNASNPSLPVRWTMVTRAKIELHQAGRIAWLEDQGQMMRVEILEPASACFAVTSAKPPTSAENQNLGASILGMDLTLGDNGPTRLAVLLTPLGDDWPPLKAPDVQPLDAWK